MLSLLDAMQYLQEDSNFLLSNLVETAEAVEMLFNRVGIHGFFCVLLLVMFHKIELSHAVIPTFL